MSVVIEEVYENDDQSAHHATGLVQSDSDSSSERVESYHDASEATSDDEWQDVTEHFDASALPEVAAPHVAAPSADAPPHSQPSLEPHQSYHPAPVTQAAPDSSVTFQADGSSPSLDSPPTTDTAAAAQIQTENRPSALLRPPDDFWDNARSSSLRNEEYGSAPSAAAEAEEDSSGFIEQQLPDGTAEAPPSEEIVVLTAEETEVLYKLHIYSQNSLSALQRE